MYNKGMNIIELCGVNTRAECIFFMEKDSAGASASAVMALNFPQEAIT